MPCRQRRQHRLLQHGIEHQPGGAAHRRAYEGGVQPLVQDRVHQLAGAGFLQRHRNARHALAKPAQHGGHKGVQGGGAGKAHRQPPLLPGRGAAHHVGHAFGTGQHGAGLFQQRQAGLCRAHAARQAAHQQNAQFLFQPAQQARERRLLHAEALGGAGDVAFFGQHDEGAQPA